MRVTSQETVTIGAIRSFVRSELRLWESLSWGGSAPAESYGCAAVDDPDFSADSVYVPSDIKDAIRLWMHEMGMDASKRPADTLGHNT